MEIERPAPRKVLLFILASPTTVLSWQRPDIMRWQSGFMGYRSNALLTGMYHRLQDLLRKNIGYGSESDSIFLVDFPATMMGNRTVVMGDNNIMGPGEEFMEARLFTQRFAEKYNLRGWSTQTKTSDESYEVFILYERGLESSMKRLRESMEDMDMDSVMKRSRARQQLVTLVF